MCVYSMVIDYERKHVHEYYPWVEPYIYPSSNTNPPPWILPDVLYTRILNEVEGK